MKATTKIQAERVAKAGAAKMNALTHTMKDCSIKRLRGIQFTIINNDNAARYTVSIDPAKTFCGCPFFRENREFGACKHIEYARQEQAWEEARVAEWETAQA